MDSLLALNYVGQQNKYSRRSQDETLARFHRHFIYSFALSIRFSSLVHLWPSNQLLAPTRAFELASVELGRVGSSWGVEARQTSRRAWTRIEERRGSKVKHCSWHTNANFSYSSPNERRERSDCAWTTLVTLPAPRWIHQRVNLFRQSSRAFALVFAFSFSFSFDLAHARVMCSAR